MARLYITLADEAPSRGNGRALIVVLAFVIWGAVIVARLSQVMVVADHRPAAADNARRQARPGRTTARPDGAFAGTAALPRSEHFSLRWRIPADPEKVADTWMRLTRSIVLPSQWSEDAVLKSRGTEVVLKPELAPAEVAVVEPLCRARTGLFVRPQRATD